MGVHGSRVAVAAEAQLRDRGRDALVRAVDLDELEDRAEDLARGREVVADAAGPHDEQLRALGDRKAGEVRERGRGLRHGLDVRRPAAALREEQLRERVLLGVGEEERALALHRGLQRAARSERSTMADCSEAQAVPQSKILAAMMQRAA